MTDDADWNRPSICRLIFFCQCVSRVINRCIASISRLALLRMGGNQLFCVRLSQPERATRLAVPNVPFRNSHREGFLHAAGDLYGKTPRPAVGVPEHRPWQVTTSMAFDLIAQDSLDVAFHCIFCGFHLVFHGSFDAFIESVLALISSSSHPSLHRFFLSWHRCRPSCRPSWHQHRSFISPFISLAMFSISLAKE